MGSNQSTLTPNNPVGQFIREIFDPSNESVTDECTIYVLRCQGGKYYVGRTARKMSFRYKEHQMGKGSEWTKMYPPIEIYDEHTGDKWVELTTFYRIMEKFGMDNVRGATYCMIKLSDEDRVQLNNKIKGVNRFML